MKRKKEEFLSRPKREKVNFFNAGDVVTIEGSKTVISKLFVHEKGILYDYIGIKCSDGSVTFFQHEQITDK